MRHDEAGQLQLLESVTVAVFIFVAIATVAIFRLPTSPQVQESSELETLAADALRVRQAKTPDSGDDCNEIPCPFSTDIDRLVSLALGYIGPTVGAPAEEAPDASDFQLFLDQALPAGSHYAVYYSNGYNLTKLFPLDASPPPGEVVVARALLNVNWTVHAAQRDAGIIVRIGEFTGFPPISADMHDPLNRTETEFGYGLEALFSGRVPDNATLGTHLACGVPGAQACRAFTVVGPGVYPVGSQILAGDRDVQGGSKTLGDWAQYAKLRDVATDGDIDADDDVYLDTDLSGNVTEHDVRVSSVASCRPSTLCPSGSYVRPTDLDVGRALTTLPGTSVHLRSADATLDEGEAAYVYPTSASGGPIAENALRLSRSGYYPVDSRVATGDDDYGDSPVTAVPGAGLVLHYNDLNGNSLVDEGEIVYLNFGGALGVNDLRLVAHGQATQRNLYDVKLVVWYGV